MKIVINCIFRNISLLYSDDKSPVRKRRRYILKITDELTKQFYWILQQKVFCTVTINDFKYLEEKVEDTIEDN